MFRLRRYRVFLLIAALCATTLYYLVQVRHATLSDVDRFRHFTFGQTPHKEQSKPEHRPDLPPALSNPPPLDPEVELPPAPATTAVRGANPTLDDFAGQTPAKPAAKEAETITGEELLPGKPKKGNDLKEISSSQLKAGQSLEDTPRARWQPQQEHNPIPENKLIKLPLGKPKVLPKIQHDFPPEKTADKSDRLRKLVTIREAFKHAWKGYEQYAMPHDELMPVTNSYSDSFMGWGATLIDSLSSLWIMDFKDDFEKAVNETGKIDFKTSYKKEIPIFETVIRLLGGLVSAHDLSNGEYPVLLEKAVELADILLGAFDTPNRMPVLFYNWAPSYASQQHRAGTRVVLAQLGSLSMEFTRLAQITKNNRYYDAIARVQNALEEWQMETAMPGLWPLHLDASGCKKVEKSKSPSDGPGDGRPILIGSEQVNGEDLLKGDTPAESPQDDATKDKPHQKRQADDISVPADKAKSSSDDSDSSSEDDDSFCETQGLDYEPYAKKHRFAIAAQADSTYEYMPKMYRLLGGLSSQYESMYKNAARVIRGKILYRPMIQGKNRKILFPAMYEFDVNKQGKTGRERIKWEATHLGCFAGGMFGIAAKTFNLPSDMDTAKQLTDGCVWAYESTPTRIMPEKFALTACEDVNTCLWDETKWHRALDPQLTERVNAVEAWNKEQKKLYQQTGMNVAKSDPQLKAPSAEEPQTTNSEEKSGKPLVRRDPPVAEDPTKASLHVYEDDENPLGQVGFTPKVAMSHDRYVKARIQEERLPPGYTKIQDRSYILRPEAIESVFIMWRITGEDYWRQKGWDMFQAIQEATHTESGNAGLEDVTSILGEKQDKMESFWLAETLKYFYLLFSEPTVVSLDDYVFNTEAHPFKVPRS